MTTSPRIVIVGGGPAGLMCARVLQRQGIRPVVYDAGTTVRGQAGTGRDRHRSALAEFIPADGDQIDRGQLRILLHQPLKPGTVHWGHELVHVAPLGGGVHRLEFANGVSAEADLVIGADGAWSTVRPLLTDAVQRGFWTPPAPLTWDHVPGATLIGDAAHLTGPFSGHGMSRAMLDGAELAHAITEEDNLDDAVARYEAAMFPRSGELAVRTCTPSQRRSSRAPR
ncbi:hypothetical protein ALI144C_37080 [Actinosynnema sp. ALI-1.44]|uniref:FAD-dependent oxidoreductase n=1 Tax=Actinosynnema sp. ALI-1.44 TaxID=1933779 RepID=UPI00097BF6FA|nr:FAD-dependent monooxygenase [Actinosynnema sp. ALI-1.44]ONI76275.1 hypothetical protein ALI144C_37080 [Actinosynnema sp. ALI-1.44]